MTIHQFLALFPVVKETRKGWDVCCPAHDDHHPSLGVLEGENGKIVLNCFAGCTTEAICEALGVQLSDLFADTPLNGHVRPLRILPKKVSKRSLAFAYELHALDLRMHADKILDASKNCQDCKAWTNEETESAMKAVSRAYLYQDRARFCEGYADHLREEDYESKRFVSRQP